MAGFVLNSTAVLRLNFCAKMKVSASKSATSPSCKTLPAIVKPPLKNMNIKSKRKKRFILLLLYVSIVVIFILTTSLINRLQLKEIFSIGLIITVLLANIIFFVMNLSTIIITEDFVQLKFPILRKNIKLKYDEIVGHDNTNSSVYLFKSKENEVFVIRKFEFKNYQELTKNISSKTPFLKISIFSNAKKGLFSYFIAIMVVLLLFLISTGI